MARALFRKWCNIVKMIQYSVSNPESASLYGLERLRDSYSVTVNDST